ncbi:MAG: NPCBM/NEW2 domain-containing protein [Eubacteriales bacterium]|nr:NPCBM/NEW2 domain-containing protein [Eubacteriales bacterium]
MRRKNIRKNVVLFLSVLLTLCFSCTVQAEEESIPISKMHELDKRECYIWEEGITDSYGNTYKDNVISVNGGLDGYLSYNLDGEYSRFHGKITTYDETNSNAYMNVAIYGDGQELYSKSGITRQMEAQPFDIDVTGIGKLEIRCDSTEWQNSELFFVDSYFTKAKERVVSRSYTTLQELVVIDSANFESDIYLQTDTFGTLHRGTQVFEADYSEQAYALYNLNQQYVKFQGKLVAGHDTKSEGSADVQIYLDDNLVFEQKGIGRSTSPVEVDLDVTNAKIMKVQVLRHDGDIYLVDDILSSHDHKPGDWEVEKEPTCAEKGKKVQYCTECKEICNTQVIETLDHKPGDWEVEQEPTCENEGEKVKRCKECGSICDKETLPRTEHEPGEWETDVEPTCWSEGEESLYCEYCGELLDYREIPISDHEPEEEWTVEQEPTCTYEGTQIKCCQYCGETVEVQKIPKLKHKFGEWVTTEGSVWNGPIVKTRICSNCYIEETKNVYTWIWVKPVVIILVILGTAAIVLGVLLNQKGMAFNLENIKTLLKGSADNLKSRQKENESESDSDIFGESSGRGKRREKDKEDDDIFNSHQ